ncbi:MAG: stage V sporulation protein AE [Firmicutes bacterium]|nr:stage V sporulation protein AE [Bacillota bacterium]MCL5971708.1 stage V sporulation protein AE [Bacillota bacterium]
MAHDVIVVTDGDETAYRAIDAACQELELFALKASQGNPTPLSGKALVQAVLEAPKEPVVVMVDDRGQADQGVGERDLEVLLKSPKLNVLGVVAVAANTRHVEGVAVDASVTQTGEITDGVVDKQGRATSGNTLHGDTVDVLQGHDGLPVIGLGDPGKMEGHDSMSQGVPATKKALQEILRRSGYHGS